MGIQNFTSFGLPYWQPDAQTHPASLAQAGLAVTAEITVVFGQLRCGPGHEMNGGEPPARQAFSYRGSLGSPWDWPVRWLWQQQHSMPSIQLTCSTSSSTSPPTADRHGNR